MQKSTQNQNEGGIFFMFLLLNVNKQTFPGSFRDRATLTKHLFSDKLWRIEFWNEDGWH